MTHNVKALILARFFSFSAMFVVGVLAVLALATGISAVSATAVS